MPAHSFPLKENASLDFDSKKRHRLPVALPTLLAACPPFLGINCNQSGNDLLCIPACIFTAKLDQTEKPKFADGSGAKYMVCPAVQDVPCFKAEILIDRPFSCEDLGFRFYVGRNYSPKIFPIAYKDEVAPTDHAQEVHPTYNKFTIDASSEWLDQVNFDISKVFVGPRSNFLQKEPTVESTVQFQRFPALNGLRLLHDVEAAGNVIAGEKVPQENRHMAVFTQASPDKDTNSDGKITAENLESLREAHDQWAEVSVAVKPQDWSQLKVKTTSLPGAYVLTSRGRPANVAKFYHKNMPKWGAILNYLLGKTPEPCPKNKPCE